MSALARAARWRDAAPRLTVWPAAEAGLALIGLLLFSNALIAPLLADPARPDDAEALRLVWPPVYALTLFLMALSPGAVWRVTLRSWPLVLLALLTMISAAWSIDPEVSVRRGLAVVMTLAFGLWLAARYSWRDLIRLIALTFAILAVGSLIAGAVFPGFGVMQEVHPGAWRGLWWEKNTLGAMMAWGALAFLAAAACARGVTEQRLWFALVPLALLLVLLATSRTAFLATAIALGGPLAIALSRRDFSFAALTGFGVTVAAIGLLTVLMIGPAVLLEMLGRDATFTGRTDIWEALGRAIAERPWTGYGYGAFWGDERGPVFWVLQVTQWPVPTAHNAWLETALAIGIPGTVLALWVYLAGLWRAGRGFRTGLETYWTLPFLAAWGVISLSESNLLQQNGFVWLLLTATLAKLAADKR
ncbi:O-antigen ligase family protein [Alkalicaulis satelles]|uniref:O-antigen ligase family protein n=1 Tax=Alkalicaulis satelles TaxID=2609175 RepID=A0A5M6ZQZ3_9PROT|nr:O-antigen ligase family protein [Alkalicaulis satelles]KAA5804701.1 O-antigen ligase family protein [Alkalicaulis satelles]